MSPPPKFFICIFHMYPSFGKNKIKIIPKTKIVIKGGLLYTGINAERYFKD